MTADDQIVVTIREIDWVVEEKLVFLKVKSSPFFVYDRTRT